jgi:putative transposase
MPNKPSIQTGEFYHVYNRGVEKRDVFCERVDYIRFLHNLFEFNSTMQAPEFKRRYKPGDSMKTSLSYIKPGKKIVDIVAFCPMKKHYHLLVRPLVEGGLSRFMLKVGTGYTNAFNEKNERVGSLFQGPYKAKHVDREEYLQHLICYIHLNPLKFLRKYSKDKKIDFIKTWNALGKYRWSSHLDYLGEDNFGTVLDKKFILELFGSTGGYREFVQDYIKNESEKEEVILPIAIEE